MRSRFQVLRIRRKCSVCSLFMYCSPRRGMYGLTLRGPASRLVLETSGLSPSSASPPAAASRSLMFRGVTGLAGIVGLAGIAAVARTGFAGTLAAEGCGLTAAGFGTGAGVGLAAGFATALGLGAGLGLATAAGFFAGAAFLAESAFFAMVFLAFVAFAGFLAAILRSLPGTVRNGLADVHYQKRGAIIQTALRRYRTTTRPDFRVLTRATHRPQGRRFNI